MGTEPESQIGPGARLLKTAVLINSNLKGSASDSEAVVLVFLYSAG